MSSLMTADILSMSIHMSSRITMCLFI